MSGAVDVLSPAVLMQAAVVMTPGTVELLRVPRPEPANGEVRVRLEGCGVCGSNLPVWEGRPWFQYPLDPGAPGHEGWGVIDAVGVGVTTVTAGDRVAALSARAFAEYDVVAEDAVIRLPESLGISPFPGEPLGCAMNVFERSGIASGQVVVVIGIGFLGAVLVSLAAASGATVIAASRRAFALDLARSLGAHDAVSLDDSEALHRAVRNARAHADASGATNDGADCVIEATGLQAPLDLASDLVCVRGRLVVAGYHQDGLRHVNMQQWNWRGIDVINAHEREPARYMHGMRRAVEAVERGIIPLDQLLTHRYALADLADAMHDIQHRPDGFLKALVLA